MYSIEGPAGVGEYARRGLCGSGVFRVIRERYVLALSKVSPPFPESETKRDDVRRRPLSE